MTECKNECAGACATKGEKPERRTFVKWMVGGFTALYALLFVQPVYRFLGSGDAEEGGEQVTQISFPDGLKVQPGNFKMFKFGSKPGILIRHSDTEFTAFLASCMHMGCTVSYTNTPQSMIVCACHGGRYDPKSGKNVAGPPPKPLPKLQVEIAGEELLIKKA